MAHRALGYHRKWLDEVGTPMELQVTPEKMAEYVAGARTREAARRAAASQRRERAWVAAAKAARVLREAYGAQRVVAFGSLVAGTFHERSDIDLAAEGIAPGRLLQAWADAEAQADGFALDVVDVARARPWVWAALASHGVEL